ncbi:hemerythrin domain-containing protein [Actinocorallia longicatena]|uniref:Hemerythrin-like domain-containing protein n=1 Tax=Actinocorallia longicatena TaxID=111803 RepID=A0ABP6QG41_9ACTN
MSDELDMTAMYATHDALRRECELLARATSRSGTDPVGLLRTALGWGLLKAVLRVHHRSEDDALWPVLRQNLAGRPDDLALLEAMEAEHAVIDHVIDAIDTVLAAPHAGSDLLGDLTDSLVTGLTGHLRREEEQALPLIGEAVTAAQWARFVRIHAQRLVPATPTRSTELERHAYLHRWRTAGAALDS